MERQTSVAGEIIAGYCVECRVKSWQKRMYDMGCNVTHPKNIGKMAQVKPVRIRDCEKVVIDGVTYRDVTKLFYEDTKYKATYPSKEQWDRIRKIEGRELSKMISNIRKKEAEITKKRKKYVPYAPEEEELIIKMVKEGYMPQHIAARLERDTISVVNKIQRMKDAGLIY